VFFRYKDGKLGNIGKITKLNKDELDLVLYDDPQKKTMMACKWRRSLVVILHPFLWSPKGALPPVYFVGNILRVVRASAIKTRDAFYNGGGTVKLVHLKSLLYIDYLK